MNLKFRLVLNVDIPRKSKYLKILDDLDLKLFPDCSVHDKRFGYWWAVFQGKEVVAFAGLDPTREFDRGFLCRVGVLKSHRGLGLQRRLIKIRERFAKKIGMSRLVSYCSYENLISCNNLIKSGYTRYKPSYEYGTENAIYFEKYLTNGKKTKKRSVLGKRNPKKLQVCKL